jgi:hypothetical protein
MRRVAGALACGTLTQCHTQESKRKRVLVTGFNDWRNLGDAGVWRCQENPSCRLLLGEISNKKPTAQYNGTLVKFLKENAKNTSFDFVTLPTVGSMQVCYDATTPTCTHSLLSAKPGLGNSGREEFNSRSVGLRYGDPHWVGSL